MKLEYKNLLYGADLVNNSSNPADLVNDLGTEDYYYKDSDRLRQIVINLRKYMDKKGHFAVVTENYSLKE